MGMEDLDELVTKCRGESGREYIREAVACYRAGAYRSAIVATWQAVFFDILYKYKELDLTGDKEANKQLDEFKKTFGNPDHKKFTVFENNILKNAKEKFELLTDNELYDLNRLHDDRHRCAHPSMNDVETVYNPSPELARTHIKNAIDILLSREPVQGKSVVENILQTINSEYFPKNTDDAYKYLKSGYLKRARESVVSNIVICIIKECFSDNTESGKAKTFSLALNAIHKLYPTYTENTLKTKLTSILNSIIDTNIYKFLILNYHFKTIWIYTDDSFKIKIEELIKIHNNNKDALNIYLSLYIYDDKITSIAHDSIKNFSDSQMKYVLTCKHSPRKLYDKHFERLLNITIESSSFRSSEENIEKFILPFAEYISKDELMSFLTGALENDQIYYAGKIPLLLIELFDKTSSKPELLRIWKEFKEQITEKHCIYSELKEKIESFQVYPPPLDTNPNP